MPQKTMRSELTLKGLELFQLTAKKGSLKEVAIETGLSISTVSHHLKSLEEHLGVALFNHSRRPLVLSPKGQGFLRDIEEALMAIRKASADASAGDLVEARYLRLGTIEDFDSDIIPELAVFLNARMPRCDFLYHSDISQRICDMLRDRQLDLGITSRPTERLDGLQEIPLLHDPFVVALPRNLQVDLPALLAGQGNLPFLRFSGNLMIARQIESQLRRLGRTLPHRFECGNNQTLMAMVAAGAGWTITTPLLFARARRFQTQLTMQAFPGKSFSRTLSLVASPECPASILKTVEAKMRDLITRHALQPMHQNAPWLVDKFRLAG